jgi:peroxiredoxin
MIDVMRLLAIVSVACSALVAAPAVIRSGCGETDATVATVPDSTPIRVHSALADGSLCYSVTAELDGRVLSGYVRDPNLPAVATFENERRAAFRQAVTAKQIPSPVTNAAPAATPPLSLTRFPDFETRDLSGKTVRLSSLRGKVILVTFWSPSNPKTLSQLRALRGLYTEFHPAGLDAVGIAMTGSDRTARAALDDTELDWPQISDQKGLARTMNIGANEQRTFVLDANRNVVAADLHGAELGALVSKMLNK